MKLADVEAASVQISLERDLLESQLGKLKKEMSVSRITCSLTGITVSSIEEMELLQRVEHEKRELEGKVASMKRSIERLTKERECEKHIHEV